MKQLNTLTLILAFILSLTLSSATTLAAPPTEPVLPPAKVIHYKADIDAPTVVSCSSLPTLKTPTLIAPANGSTLNTISPLYQYSVDPDMNVTGMIFELEVSLDPTFYYGGGFHLWHYMPWQTLSETWRDPRNLGAGEKYYMRARLRCQEDDRLGPYTAVWSFTAGSGGTLLPAPELLAPADGALVPPPGPTMTWSAVPGTIEYLPQWHEAGSSGGSWSWVTGLGYTEKYLTLGTSYEWFVAARNDYGIGAQSAVRTFTYGNKVLQVDSGGGALSFVDVRGNLTSLVFPAGAVNQSTMMTLAATTPGSSPPNHSWAWHAFTLSASQGGQAVPGLVFGAPVQVTINYTDDDLGGMPEDSLKLMMWDEARSEWLDAACGPYDRRPGENQLTALICRVGQFALFGAGVAHYSCNRAVGIPKVECEALVALYDGTNGPGWTNNAGWLATDTPCSWNGVSCNGGHVARLVLGFNALSGPIPAELGNLAGLENLDLGYNQLTGAIPAELGSMPVLWNLRLSWNQLIGPIPPGLGSLAKLRVLSLNGNQLTGAIPSELANLTQLEDLYLYTNRLTGPIPPQLANLANLQTINISSNQLTGTVPPGLAKLTNLQYLVIHENQLTGSIPPELGDLTNLETLSLSYNHITGTIPSQLGDLANLRSLGLNYNQLTGSIPPELGNLTKLLDLSLDANQLTGPIPAELGNLVNLSGPWTPTYLNDQMGVDQTGGTAPLSPEGGGGRYSGLWLGENQLTGPIPTTLQNLTQLEYMDLSNNRLSGSVPAEFGKLSALKSLRIDHNPLTGALPSSLTAVPLDLFYYDATDLGEPGDAAFQAWLSSITYLKRTDILCGARTLNGVVWNDLNRNGNQDAGEPSISGVTVILTRDAGMLAAITAGRQVVTGSDGRYAFANLAAGAYLLSVAPSERWPTVPDPVAIGVPEDRDVTAPAIGLTGASLRVFLPVIQR